MTRLFIIEDHATLIVSSMRFHFRPRRDDIKVSGFTLTIEDAIKKADPATFDLFILDLHIPGHNPIENIRKLKQHFPGKPVAIYTAESSAAWKKRMLEEGALTYITKDAPRSELKSAIQSAARGALYIVNYAAPHGSPVPGDEILPGSISLTDFQVEIVKLLSEGLAHKDISSRLGISRAMIEKALANIRKLLKVQNNLEMIKVLSKHGLI